jgi:hypothetical protein
MQQPDNADHVQFQGRHCVASVVALCVQLGSAILTVAGHQCRDCTVVVLEERARISGAEAQRHLPGLPQARCHGAARYTVSHDAAADSIHGIVVLHRADDRAIGRHGLVWVGPAVAPDATSRGAARVHATCTERHQVRIGPRGELHQHSAPDRHDWHVLGQGALGGVLHDQWQPPQRA